MFFRPLPLPWGGIIFIRAESRWKRLNFLCLTECECVCAQSTDERGAGRCRFCLACCMESNRTRARAYKWGTLKLAGIATNPGKSWCTLRRLRSVREGGVKGASIWGGHTHTHSLSHTAPAPARERWEFPVPVPSIQVCSVIIAP